MFETLVLGQLFENILSSPPSGVVRIDEGNQTSDDDVMLTRSAAKPASFIYKNPGSVKQRLHRKHR